MLTFLTGKKQRTIAWFLFVLFYGDMIAAAHASIVNSHAIPASSYGYSNYSAVGSNNLHNTIPVIKASLISKADAKENALTKKDELPVEDNYSSLVNGDAFLKAPLKGTIGGPGQPEMSTFKSVGADNMVNLFTGDFSYNIPLLDVDGYPINIFYNAEPTMDQEASWVGLGWNINPGTINRNMRGLPDDFDGTDSIIKEQHMKPDITVGVSGDKGKEIIGKPQKGLFSISNYRGGAFYNNKRGVGFELGLDGEFNTHQMLAVGIKDERTGKDTGIKIIPDALQPGGLSTGITLNSQTGLTPSISFQKDIWQKDRTARLGLSTSIDFNSRTGLGDLRLSGEMQNYKYNYNKEKGETETIAHTSANLFASNISFARASYTPSIRMPITNFNATFSAKFGKEFYGVSKTSDITGYYTQSSISEKYRIQTKPAFGYMYYEKANGNPNALLDFNRLNDGNYTMKTPVISLPVYTYDVFTISGEGTGGSFRGYRGNMGYVRDNYTRTNSGKVNLALEFSKKKIVKGGTIIGGVYSATESGEWETENAMKATAAFMESDKLEQKGFYFKNPGEKAIIDQDYYNNMGQDKLMRPVMGTPLSLDNVPPFLTPTPILKSKFQLFNKDRNKDITVDVNRDSYRKLRDKRTQVISYLTAQEADRVGLDRDIYSYTEKMFRPGMCSKERDGSYRTPIRRYDPNNTDPEIDYRKDHHISEITVQEGSKRYVYGLPVYQKIQKDVTFSVGTTVSPDTKGLVSYTPKNQNSSANKEGKDGLFQSETIPPYAHSFLLTAILSPDYSDLTGDGISDDDLGTAIKFNYTRANKRGSSPNSWADIKWRLPVEKDRANFNRGLLTDNQDNKAMYTYGEKELWYTHSIESKNMVATFTVSDRRDGWGVIDENGGVNDGANAPCQKKLDKIDLYSKADFIKYGPNAKPIKTVHFVYSYKLCKNYVLFSGDATDGNGKLTLESIYFTYNNNTHQKNRYRFKYADQDATTAEYNSVENDRWGNYKPHIQNPATADGTRISNEDYPYSNQNKAQADANAATWSLNQVLLPSGAKIDITYEADDYAYVQNRRAAQMTKILGFAFDKDKTPENKLYTNTTLKFPWDFSHSDYRYVFFDAPVPVNSKEDIQRLYLQDLKQLLLKLWVKMPKGTFYGTDGYEPMFVYCNIDDYGLAIKPAGTPGAGEQDHTKFYIKVGQASHNNGSQVMETANQFLRDQLPGKAYPGSDLSGSTAAGQTIKALFAMVNNIRTGVTGFENNARADGWCKEIDDVRSVARLCNPDFKKIGGGHRVKSVKITDNFKRMLTSSAEIASVYGQEYDYTTTEIVNGQPKIISSGVASYEPGVGNEENPFREILQYSNKTPLGPTANSTIELPIAETFFPSPSVGYSRVTVKSIHNKANNENLKSGVGMQETQFFTTKDFPTLSEYTDFDKASRHHFNPTPIYKIFNFAGKDYMSLSQGFRIVLNDMNGKVKMQASYPENDLKNPINKTTYFYRMNKTGENKYQLDNTVPVVSSADGQITNKLIGKDIEVMNDFREHFTFTHSAQIPLNADFFKIGNFPVLIPTVFRAVFRDESLFRSATTLKIVNEFGILDSVENVDKGSIVGTKNLVYDAETGETLVSRTNNEFNKPIYNFSYPAYWAQEEMGPAYKNIDATVKDVLFRNGKIEGGLSEADVNSIFESGDEIYVNDKLRTGVKDNAACIAIGSGNACTLLPKSDEYRIWALDVTKDTRNTTKEFIFIDRYGNPYNAAKADIRIIRSGRRNMADASVGSITSMASPIVLNSDNVTSRIFIDDYTNIVNTGAIEFKEKWKTQDAFYTKDEIQRVVRQAPILTDNAEITQSAAFATTLQSSNRKKRKFELYLNPDHFIAARYDNGGNNSDYGHRSWLLFNFDNISNLNSNSNIVSAQINLPYHQAHHSVYVDGTYTGTEHYSLNSHYAQSNNSNDFTISRMLSSWPSFTTDWNRWHAMFDAAPPAGANNSAYLSLKSPYIGPSNQDLNEDITQVVRGMLRDKYDPAKGYATALMINLTRESGRTSINRVCFETHNPDSHFPERRIYIKLKYYNCVPENPIIYQGPADNAPTTPPAGYMYCSTDEKVTSCFSVFSRQYMNPYVQGLLGNWRPLKSYVYNGERREQDFNSPTTNISKDGIIKNFETFWSLDATTNVNKKITKTNSSNAKWVSNSDITQYNRKGAELENHDPLGRYNTGIYGYNESLPVAVVNNSRLRLSAFDGFEDYFFKDQSCDMYCQPNKRHFDTKINTGQLSGLQAHTGRYSFQTDHNSNSSIKIKISPDNLVNEPDILIHESKNTVNIQTVQLLGKGLYGDYQFCNSHFGSCEGQGVNNDMVNLNDNVPPEIQTDKREHMRVVWSGVLQVGESGQYDLNFLGNVDDEGDIWIDLGSGGQQVHNQKYSWVISHVPVSLVAGHPYTINVGFKQTVGDFSINLAWNRPCEKTPSLIPRENLYMLNSPIGAITTIPVTCTKIDSIKAQSNYLIDEFNLIPGQKMIASVWVKKGVTDCRCSAYTGFNLKLKDQNGNILPNSEGDFVAKGGIIEGWQLMEATFNVPSGTEMSLYIENNNSNDQLFIDDLRFHPYNANMKSFVYNPYNLKPSAELDENNYATFYEYDDDGTLIRVKKETKLGIKTIQETRSGLQKVITDF